MLQRAQWLLVLLLGLLLMVGAVGCEEEDPTEPTIEDVPVEMVGTWSFVAYIEDGEVEPVEGYIQMLMIEEDGDWRVMVGTELWSSGTSVVESSGSTKRLIVTITESPNSPSEVGTTEEFIYRLFDTYMTFDYEEDGVQCRDILARNATGHNAFLGVLFDMTSSQAVVGASVTLTPGSGTPLTTTSDAYGFFAFQNASSGLATIAATHDDYSSLSQSVSVLNNVTTFIGFPMSQGSAGTTITVNCTVTDENDEPLEGVLLQVNDSQSATTGPSGVVSFTMEQGFRLIEATRDGYLSDSHSWTAVAGETYNLTFQLYPETSGGVGTISGLVTDSQTGDPLQGVVVETDLDETTQTNAYGLYSLSASAGIREVTYLLEGYVTTTHEVYVPTDGAVNHNVVLSPQLAGTTGTLRFVLSWLAEPEDLDSYLRVPEINGSEHTVCFWNSGSETDPPYATLDIDETDGYGPETITIYNFVTGTYLYYVHKYTYLAELVGCEARVDIYDTEGLVQSLVIPTSGSGDYWYVCDINGDTGVLTIVNQIQAEEPGGSPLGKRAK